MQPDKAFPQFEDKCWYKAKFKEFEESEGKFGPLLHLTFEMLTGEMADGSPAKGKECRAMLPQELTPKGKLYAFVKIFEGKDLAIDDVVDLSAYKGKKVLVFVENGTKEREDGTPYQNVTAIKKMKIVKK